MISPIIFGVAFLWVLGGYAIGYWAKGRPGTGVILGFLIGPLGWLLMLGFEDHRVRCNQCQGLSQPNTEKCRYCRRPLPKNGGTQTVGHPPITDASGRLLCGMCREPGVPRTVMGDTFLVCPDCNRTLSKSVAT